MSSILGPSDILLCFYWKLLQLPYFISCQRWLLKPRWLYPVSEEKLVLFKMDFRYKIYTDEHQSSTTVFDNREDARNPLYLKSKLHDLIIDKGNELALLNTTKPNKCIMYIRSWKTEAASWTRNVVHENITAVSLYSIMYRLTAMQ